jgi:hypothetical protein
MILRNRQSLVNCQRGHGDLGKNVDHGADLGPGLLGTTRWFALDHVVMCPECALGIVDAKASTRLPCLAWTARLEDCGPRASDLLRPSSAAMPCCPHVSVSPLDDPPDGHAAGMLTRRPLARSLGGDPPMRSKLGVLMSRGFLVGRWFCSRPRPSWLTR